MWARCHDLERSEASHTLKKIIKTTWMILEFETFELDCISIACSMSSRSSLGLILRVRRNLFMSSLGRVENPE